jgi:exonuclease III
MLEDFLWTQDIDIALLQDVTCQPLDVTSRNTQYINVGTEKIGTAILAKDGIMLTDIRCLPSGRGITAKYNGIRLINLYATSGSEKQLERESFYNTEVPYLPPGHNTEIILAGDFICVLSPSDATGQKNYSRALDKLMTGLKLQDTGEQNPASTTYTHYIPRGAFRINRIYISNNLKQRNHGISTVVAAFTDHLAIRIRMASSDPIPTRGRGQWKMNTSVLKEGCFRRILQHKSDIWRNHRKYYPTPVLWWEGYVKRMLKQTFTWEGAARRRDRRDLENFYFEAIYALLQTPTEHAARAAKLKN